MNKNIFIFIMAVVFVGGVIAVWQFWPADTPIVPSGPGEGKVEYWAVLYASHLGNNEALILKDMLIKSGWEEDHIRHLSPREVSRDSILSSLAWLRNNSDDNDIILFYSSTHGYNDGIYDVSSRFMTYAELGEEFDTIKHNGLAIVIYACYSGNAISYLQGSNRVVLTSDSGNQPTGWQFHEQFFYALQGFGDIKGNNNNWVSIEEAFNFMEVTYASERPQMKDDYPGELDIVFLNGKFSDLDQYNVTPDFILFANYVVGAIEPEYNNASIAQSFQPSYPILTKVMLEVDKSVNTNPGPLTVSIKKDLSGPDLTSTKLNQSAFSSSDGPNLYEFDFPDIEVVPNETYFIAIRAPEAVYGGGDYVGYNFRGFKNNYLKGKVHNINYPPKYLLPLGEHDLFFATFGKR